MLKQEAKIKAEEKRPTSDWMEKSKELKFGGLPKKYQTAPPPEENIKLPTQPVKYTYTVTPSVKSGESSGLSFFDRFRRAGSGKGGSGGGPQGHKGCISGSCKEMMSEKAGKPTNQQNIGGAPGLSLKPQYSDRVVKKSKEQMAIDQEKYNTAQAEMERKKAERQARREANAAAYKASIEEQNAPKGVYANPRDLTPIRMKKTGGKLTKKR
jgi:hypothetical protein